MEEQDTKVKNSPDESPKINISELAGQLGLSEKYLNNQLSGDETREEALVKLAKTAVNAQKKLGEQGSLLSKYKGMIEKNPLEGNIEPPIEPPKKDEGTTLDLEKEENIDKLMNLLENADTIETKQKELMAQQEKIGANWENIEQQGKNAYSSIIERDRRQRCSDSYSRLEKRVGLEVASKYYDPNNPTKSVIGQVLEGDLSGESPAVRTYTQKLRTLAFSTKDPVEKVFMEIGDKDDKIKYLSEEPPWTEGAGKSNLGEAGKNTEEDKKFWKEFDRYKPEK